MMSVSDPGRRTFGAHVPVLLEVPDRMQSAVAEVLDGEYEAGFFGEGVTILDIGANVGSFSVWANMRWPGSTIHAYEPHPGTFGILARNVAALPNVQTNNVAVYPTSERELPFFARYVGDGEAGLADCMARTFAEVPRKKTLLVRTLHPAELPGAEIVKLDVEGVEGEILGQLDLSAVELIVLEFQDDANRRAIKDRLANDFVLEHEVAYGWDDLVHADLGYRPQLIGDHFGRMFFARPQLRRLRKLAGNGARRR